MALTKAKLIELIDNGDIDVGGGGGFGQNILHNWDFRNPVNQRAVTGAITTGTYFYDRWIRNSGTVTTNAAYLTLGAGTEIEQRIEGNLLAGETVTVSVMVGGTVYSGTGIMPTSGTASVTLTGWGTATLGYATGYMYVRLSPTEASNVVRVKLEMGTVSTLAYDPPMDYGMELLKCQRYYERLGTGMYFMAYTATSVIASSPFTVHKRITPSFSLLRGTMIVTDAFSDYTATTPTMWGFGGDTKGMRQAILGGFTGLTVGKIYYCSDSYGGIIGVSADL